MPPKILADTVNVASGPLSFAIGFSSGANNYAYWIPPALAVALNDHLTKQIELFESQFGKIDTSGNSTVSPLQAQ